MLALEDSEELGVMEHKALQKRKMKQEVEKREALKMRLEIIGNDVLGF